MRTLLLTLLVLGSTTAQLFAVPQLNNLSQYGVKIGEPTVVFFDGAELAPEPRILSTLPIKTQKVQDGAAGNRVGIEITVDESAQPGTYAIRIASSLGVSNPVLLGVDKLPQQAFAEETKALPVALFGGLSGAEVRRTTFAGTKGQRIVVDVEARRLGANFKPVLRLYDARGRQVAFAASQPWWGGDARIITTLPADGNYTAELHDQLYRGGGPGMFRLKIGDLQTADRVHPAAVALNNPAKLSLLGGSLARDAMSEFNPAGKLVGDHAASWPNVPLASGPRPSLDVSDHAEAIEAAPAAAIQEVAAANVGISGILSATGEEDRYAIPVAAGQKLRVEVHARRLGSPCDAVLSIRNEQGGQLAAMDDVPGSPDPVIAEFNVPANLPKIVVAVKDLLGRGSPDMNYRIVVRDLAKPDFTISLTSDRLNIPAGGTQIVNVQVARQSYAGPIKLELRGLPSNIQVQGTEIAAGATAGMMTLTAPAGVVGAGLVTIVGTGGDAAAPIVRVARGSDLAGTQLVPYLRDEIAWGVSAPLPINLAWTPSSETLVQGVPLPAVGQLTRAANVAGNVRYRLITTQPPVKKTVKVNNQDQQVDDPARILRLEIDPIATPDMSEARVSLFVPGDLPVAPWDAALVAELLGADNKAVVATAYAPVRRFNVVAPLALELTSANTAAAKAGAGETGKFTGKIVRSGGFNKPVLVTLTGLPANYAAPVVNVAADKSDFALDVRFPFGTPPGELKNLQLVALQDRNNGAGPKSNVVAVTLNIAAGEKPMAEKPKEIFEDDEKFFAAFADGGGKIENSPEKHSGNIALRVTPDQKFSVKLPGVEYKIRENPAPGEYRFIRFAWRKAGGTAICLQLAHDGQFGNVPGGSGREGAKFRYHAGPAGECYGGSVTVDANLPGGYVVVTRDLFADFGDFTLTGLSLSAVDGEAAWFDGLYLGRTADDFGELPK